MLALLRSKRCTFTVSTVRGNSCQCAHVCGISWLLSTCEYFANNSFPNFTINMVATYTVTVLHVLLTYQSGKFTMWNWYTAVSFEWLTWPNTKALYREPNVSGKNRSYFFTRNMPSFPFSPWHPDFGWRYLEVNIIYLPFHLFSICILNIPNIKLIYNTQDATVNSKI